MSPQIRHFPMATALILVLTQAAAAQAQQNPTEADATRSASVRGLDEIVVTARRSEERLQDVPVSVTAMSGAFLERQNVVDASSLTKLAPNLTIAAQPSSMSAAAVFIRGIGNTEPSALSEQGVGIYLDGVYLARAAGVLFDLAEMERVEVLRGPQGTLFGRNTIGGAVQFVSKKPTDDFQANLKTGYARFNEWYLRTRVDSGYLGQTPLKFSISASHRQGDGYVDNLLAPSSKDPGAINADTVAFALQGDFDSLTVNYNFDYDDRRGTPAFFQMTHATPDVIAYYSQSPLFGGKPFLISPTRLDEVYQEGFVDRKGNFRFNSRSKNWGHSLTLNYDATSELTLKSITGYRNFRQDTITALGGNGGLLGVVLDPVTFQPSIAPVNPYIGNNAPQRQWQFSQELQALGTSGDFSYLAGLYYFYEKASENNRQALTFVLPGGGAGLNLNPVQAFGGTAESIAAFGQVSWKPASLDDRLELTGGLRYTSDKKTATLRGDVQPSVSGSVKADNVSWLASASYKLTDDIMAFARASTGYRSGGINPRASMINTFDPEKAMAYEVGLKSEFFDRMLQLNISGYLTDYSDLQVQQFAAGTGGATTLIVNAGKVQLKGFEAEMVAAPVAGLRLDASVGYIDTKYKQFDFLDPTTNQVIDVAAQAKPAYTPTWSVRVGGEYSQELSLGTARLRVDYSYRSTQYYYPLDFTTPFNEQVRSRPDYNLKARLSLEEIAVGGSTMEIGIWGDNLTNDENISYSIDFGSLGFAGSTFKKPRTYGIDAKISF
ncbi:MAG TPA: TonB-dependent receptor [Pedomonas sp.]|uniref:TonB-dependent receptor n=1 Tax=Pedomonas sp. TaxID=2976421 RepID=UPI002F3FA23C